MVANNDNSAVDEIESVEIEVAFARLATERLLQAAPHIELDREAISGVVKKMCKTGFKVIKEEYRNED